MPDSILPDAGWAAPATNPSGASAFPQCSATWERSRRKPAPAIDWRSALAGGGTRRHDTLDKIDETILVRDTRIFLHAVWRLLAEPMPPLDYAAHAERC